MKKLNTILEEIATKLDLATNRQDAINKGQNVYLKLDCNTFYGGYRLINVDINTGGHFGTFGESGVCARIPLKQMEAYLNGILTGINLKNN